MTAPAFHQQGPTGGSFSGATSVQTGYPTTGNVAGDFAILQVSISNANPTITWPAGFTEIYQGAQTADFYFGCAWARLAGTEDGLLATTSFGGTSCNGTSRMVTYSGVARVGNPIEGASTNSGTGSTATANSIVTTGPDRLGVHVQGHRVNTASTEPAGWTEHVDAGANTARHVQESKTIAGSGTQASTSRTLSGSVDWIVTSLALKPPIQTASVVFLE